MRYELKLLSKLKHQGRIDEFCLRRALGIGEGPDERTCFGTSGRTHWRQVSFQTHPQIFFQSVIVLPEVKGILTSRTRFLIGFNFNSFVASLDEIIGSPYRYSISLVENEIHIVAQVVDLVRYLHSKDYILNDFGLENFLLRPDYTLKMTNAEKILQVKKKGPKDSPKYSKGSLDIIQSAN